MTDINPYFRFPGTAEYAMTFYNPVFGVGFMGGVMRWGEMPGCAEGETKLSQADTGKVMRMTLSVSDGNAITASDSLSVDNKEK